MQEDSSVNGQAGTAEAPRPGPEVAKVHPKQVWARIKVVKRLDAKKKLALRDTASGLEGCVAQPQKSEANLQEPYSVEATSPVLSSNLSSSVAFNKDCSGKQPLVRKLMQLDTHLQELTDSEAPLLSLDTYTQTASQLEALAGEALEAASSHRQTWALGVVTRAGDLMQELGQLWAQTQRVG
mmetsp:Transcript_65130/g.121392  ORF Transcript_65130/g.121392 Transcript_65130/m.121392 type:complete len:182 (-) Transcript_65130:137-682(-)